MPGKFLIKKTPKGFFRFSLIASNSMTILTSKNYSSRATCLKGIETIKKNASSEVEDQTLKTQVEKKCPKFEIYFDKANLYRYRMIASNGMNVAISEDGYSSKNGCLNGIKAIPRAIENVVIDDSLLKK
ncbi:MAG: YegP family protein [Pleomorphochaeta sp.]